MKNFSKSRRMVTHFWYLIANLLNKKLLIEKDVFEWFGPPDVIWILEGLEVNNQNTDEMIEERKQTKWPPLQVLNAYYKFKNTDIGTMLDDALIPLGQIDREVVTQIKEI